MSNNNTNFVFNEAFVLFGRALYIDIERVRMCYVRLCLHFKRHIEKVIVVTIEEILTIAIVLRWLEELLRYTIAIVVILLRYYCDSCDTIEHIEFSAHRSPVDQWRVY